MIGLPCRTYRKPGNDWSWWRTAQRYYGSASQYQKEPIKMWKVSASHFLRHLQDTLTEMGKLQCYFPMQVDTKICWPQTRWLCYREKLYLEQGSSTNGRLISHKNLLLEQISVIIRQFHLSVMDITSGSWDGGFDSLRVDVKKPMKALNKAFFNLIKFSPKMKSLIKMFQIPLHSPF